MLSNERESFTIVQRHEKIEGMKKTRIVIAGGGFAGLYAARYLDKHLGATAGHGSDPDRAGEFYPIHADVA